jgi:VanZ family protein
MRGSSLKAIKRFLWYWLPPLAWMGMLFYLSAQPDVPQPSGPFLQQLYEKGGHAFAYAILAWLYLRALRPHIHNRTTLYLVSAGLAALYALSDEYHQTFVPGRSGDLMDLVVDGAGICGAMLLSWWLERRRALRRQAADRQSPAR